jgi:hypothetical protein
MLGLAALGSAPLGSLAGVSGGGGGPPPVTDFLTIAGIVVPVMEGQAVERPDWKSQSYRAFAGNLRAQARPEKRAWAVTTYPLTATERSALLSAIGFKAHVTCAGVGLPSSVVCEVTVGDVAEINLATADGTGLLYSVALLLRQVA